MTFRKSTVLLLLTITYYNTTTTTTTILMRRTCVVILIKQNLKRNKNRRTNPGMNEVVDSFTIFGLLLLILLLLTITYYNTITYILNINYTNNTITILVYKISNYPYPCPKRFYGQFSKSHVCFCGLDSGNLRFETVRTNRQPICF